MHCCGGLAVGTIETLACSRDATEFATIVGLQQRWGTDGSEDVEQGRCHSRGALARQRPAVVVLCAMVLVIEEVLEAIVFRVECL